MIRVPEPTLVKPYCPYGPPAFGARTRRRADRFRGKQADIVQQLKVKR